MMLTNKLLRQSALAAVVSVMVAGCATQPKNKGNYTFFPPSPDEPRIQFLTSFGSEDDLGGQNKFAEFIVGSEKFHRPIWKPYGIAVTRGKVYVCDTEPDNVSVVDLVKRQIRYFKPEGSAALKLPIGIAVDSDGTRYVSDPLRGQLLIYRADGTPAGEIGKKGEMKPSGVALSPDRIYITDVSNHCVRVFNKASRDQLLVIPRQTNDTNAVLFSPTNVAVDENGRVYVSDSGGFTVKIYDAKGNHVRTLGDMGLKPGRFALPKGIAVDKQGRVYVVDAATALAQIFDAEGRLLMYFGEPKTSGPGAMYLPAGLTIDYQNVDLFQRHVAPGYQIEFLIFVTNQAGPQKVNVYGFLKKA
jgi:DNA-binding beta-propeller fold protein YncE